MSTLPLSTHAWIIANADAVADVLAYLKEHTVEFQALLWLARWNEETA